MLLVPAASHIRAEVVQSVNDFVENGGTALLLPSSFVSDEYNRHAHFLERMGVQVRRIEQISADRTGEIEHGYDQTFHERVVYRPKARQTLKVRAAGPFSPVPPELEGEGTRQEISIPPSFEVLAEFSSGQPALVTVPRGRGRLFYSATGFPQQSLGLLGDRLLDASGVARPVRVRRQDGRPPANIEARTVKTAGATLVCLVNFDWQPADVRIELDGKIRTRFYDLRKQTPLNEGTIRLNAGETAILRLD